MKYIIELISPLSEWALIEYRHISKIVGKANLIFTNCPSRMLKSLGKIQEQSITKLLQKNKTYCLLDPRAKIQLSPKDNFDFYIFGGILGDYPPQDRTQILSKKLKCAKRNLGKLQMSTDTAVLTAKTIVKDKIPYNKIQFIDSPRITIKSGFIEESVILPYRYVKKGDKSVISPELVRYVKNHPPIGRRHDV